MFEKWLSNDPKLTGGFAIASVISLVLSITGVVKNLPIDIAWIAIVLCGVPILIGAVKGLIFEHDMKADVLVAMALVASVATGEFFAAGEVALIMQIGSLLEDYTSGKAKEGIAKLIQLTPQTAHIMKDGKERTIPSEQVQVDDKVRVLAGETVPVDGIILEGETSIDQSVMTGESIPVDKKAGDKVSSGTVNQYGTFILQAEKVSADSSLQRMIKLTEEAEENKAPIVSMADKWASWLVVIALLCAVVTWIVTGEFMRAVTVLVVFCPCAFILATPTAILAGIGNAAKYGIILRSGDALERLSKIKRVAFDKTGTLTLGKPQVSETESFEERYSKEDILRIAASAEQYSEHPLGKAIVRSCKADLFPVSDFKIAAGQGISAVFEGQAVLAGKEDFMNMQKIDLTASLESAERYRNQGATVIYLALAGKLIGLLALSDTVREDSKDIIAKLKNAEVMPMLLTGDNQSAAERIASLVGISEVKANVMPEEKMQIIGQYAGGDEPICMIGDGVNDALALTTADAGIAMGGIGSDIAIESADAVLVSDDIKRIPYLFRLTQKVMQKVKINIIVAMIINITAVILSATGILTPITGALWHNFGSVFVVVNAALLLRYRDEQE